MFECVWFDSGELSCFEQFVNWLLVGLKWINLNPKSVFCFILDHITYPYTAVISAEYCRIQNTPAVLCCWELCLGRWWTHPVSRLCLQRRMCNQATERKTSVWERNHTDFGPAEEQMCPALEGRHNTHGHDAVGDGLLESVLHCFLQLGQQHSSDLFNAEHLLLLHVHHLWFAAQKRRTSQTRAQRCT